MQIYSMSHRTGLPYFSVFRLNAEIMFGAVQGDDHPTQCYGRNFASQTIPFPPGQDPMKNPYTTLRPRSGIVDP
ncbi:hypothetical protein AK812_SmicGene29889 [Symbiodinium microadriaticum]|uniref:Uncharacterized protein n=1 Tax=Symbiodinium microadriaticum TaxID=2951 RepID=A0A1Q9D0P0_SYMMI|nr:hypothetical protein AK812_SmicGene29889 [Symbiodinium microadriaticum]